MGNDNSTYTNSTSYSGEVVPFPRPCAATDAGRTDKIRHACDQRATKECLTINGVWEPLCDRHATYGPERTRPLQPTHNASSTEVG